MLASRGMISVGGMRANLIFLMVSGAKSTLGDPNSGRSRPNALIENGVIKSRRGCDESSAGPLLTRGKTGLRLELLGQFGNFFSRRTGR
jgi:hypothetical protein